MAGNRFTGTPACEQIEAAVLLRFGHLITRIGQYNRRKIAGSAYWSQHSWGNAPDIHVANLADGDVIYAWLVRNKEALGIRNILWRVRSHYDHLHVDVWPRGSYTPPLSSVGVGTFTYSTGRRASNRIQLIAPEKVWNETGVPTPTGEVNILKRGDKGLAVAKVQKALIERGVDLGDFAPDPPNYPPGADGVFGETLEDAVKAIQRHHGLDDNGVVDGVLSSIINGLADPVASGVDEVARSTASDAKVLASTNASKLSKVKAVL